MPSLHHLVLQGDGFTRAIEKKPYEIKQDIIDYVMDWVKPSKRHLFGVYHDFGVWRLVYNGKILIKSDEPYKFLNSFDDMMRVLYDEKS